MRPTEDISLEDYLRLSKTRKKTRRPGIPRAAQAERTGLTTLLRAGWSVQSPNAVQYRLYKINTALDTGLCASELDACNKAKELSKR